MTPDARKIREDILRISNHSGHGHIPTCFSIIEMLLAVYDSIKVDPANPQWNQRDIFILSKGHASLAMYAVLANKGFFPIQDVYSFGAHNSRFGCHADRLKVPGVEASTGSLGHGIGLAVGMALAFKISQNTRKVVTLVGDGEANEGSVWEAVMVASHQKLSNLTILYDNNKSQTRCQPIPNPAERFASFGLDTVVVPGHNTDAIKAELNKPADTTRVIIADTIKGYGCPSLVDDMFAWHRRSPKQPELQKLVEELHAHAV